MSDNKSTPAVATAQLTPVKQFEGQLTSYSDQMKSLLQAHGISERDFMIKTLNAIKKTPALLDADRATLFGAIFTSAELGLEPNTPMQLAFILPYKRKGHLEAQFQIGYQGWIEIMQRNPKVESIDSGIVYDKEKWHYNKGLRVPFSHEPLPPKNRGVALGAYAIAWIKGSEKPKVTFLYKEEIDMFKAISQGAASEYSPWNDEAKDPMKWMWRKTAIKQLAKELPKTREMSKAYEHDTVVELGGTQRMNDQGTVELIESEAQREANAHAKNEHINKSLGDQVADKK